LIEKSWSRDDAAAFHSEWVLSLFFDVAEITEWLKSRSKPPPAVPQDGTELTVTSMLKVELAGTAMQVFSTPSVPAVAQLAWVLHGVTVLPVVSMSTGIVLMSGGGPDGVGDGLAVGVGDGVAVGVGDGVAVGVAVGLGGRAAEG